MDFRRALASVSLLVALAGCSSTQSVTLEQTGLADAGGKDSKLIDCPSSGGKLTYAIDGTAGKVKITVQDAAETKPFDKQELSGTMTGQTDGLRGAAGTWTLIVDRSDFSGSYKVTLEC